MAHRSTHTYAYLEVSPGAYDEVHRKLLEAGYADQFRDGDVIDMHGLALKRASTKETDMVRKEVLAREMMRAVEDAGVKVSESTPSQWIVAAEHLLKKYKVEPRRDVAQDTPFSSLGEVVQ